MRIAIIGQQDFGKAVLEAFPRARRRGGRSRLRAGERGRSPIRCALLRRTRDSKRSKCPRSKGPEAVAAMKELNADIGIMAFVLQFVPQISRMCPCTAPFSITRHCCRNTVAVLNQLADHQG